MMSQPDHSARSFKRGLIPPVFNLAVRQLRQTWSLLAVMGLGLLITIVLICALPIFAHVAMNAGLRSFITEEPANRDITVGVQTRQLSTSEYQSIEHTLNALFTPKIGPYLSGSVPSSIEINALTFDNGLDNAHDFTVDGISADFLATQVHVIKGRLPRATVAAHTIELAITLYTTDYFATPIRLIAVGKVSSLPMTATGQGGVLVAYQDYAGFLTSNRNPTAEVPSTIWLQTNGDPKSLAAVRATWRSALCRCIAMWIDGRSLLACSRSR